MENSHRLSALGAAVAGALITVSASAGTTTSTSLSPNSTSFTSLSPLPDQVFFIGDGLTGNGTGTRQQFIVPPGASELVLGISDACGFNGPPSCYFDNGGSFQATFTVSSGASITDMGEVSVGGADVIYAAGTQSAVAIGAGARCPYRSRCRPTRRRSLSM